MSLINYANIIHALVHSLLTLVLEALLVLVEHVGEEQVGQEVEADEHEEHEEESVEVVDAHRGQEDVREVRRREQDGHVAIGVLNRAKVLKALKRRPVEVVDCEREDQDVREDGHENVERVLQIANQAENLLAQLSCKRKKNADAHQIREVRVLHSKEAANQVNCGDSNVDAKESGAALLSFGLVAPLPLQACDGEEPGHAEEVDETGHGG